MSKKEKPPSQLSNIRRAILALKDITTAPQMWKERERIHYWIMVTPTQDSEKKAIWKLLWHYRAQIADRQLIAIAAKKTGQPMADLMVLTEEIQ